ncbi:hypothetical protein ACFFLZ_14155 [Photobacterium aphoticum]|nr:DUF805 domain-containing protein [Photobacterium aphoticum]GHA42180.1 hypothetical protein GCM10007086_14710 [Photobacterium aphoticum]
MKFAVDKSKENYQEEVERLRQQGFEIFDENVEAESEHDALNRYHSEIGETKPTPNKKRESVPFTLYNLLFFSTNSLSRLHYIGLSSLIGGTCGLILKILFNSIVGFYGNSQNTPILISMALIFFLSFWFSLAMSVARWRNIGHSGTAYIYTMIVLMIIGFMLLTAKGTFGVTILFSLYLMIAPPNFVKPSGYSSEGNDEYAFYA